MVTKNSKFSFDYSQSPIFFFRFSHRYCYVHLFNLVFCWIPTFFFWFPSLLLTFIFLMLFYFLFHWLPLKKKQYFFLFGAVQFNIHLLQFFFFFDNLLVTFINDAKWFFWALLIFSWLQLIKY